MKGSGGFWTNVYSPNLIARFRADRERNKVEPFVTAGAVFFSGVNYQKGLNFGGGINYWFHDHVGLRFEGRDSVSWESEPVPRQNCIARAFMRFGSPLNIVKSRPVAHDLYNGILGMHSQLPTLRGFGERHDRLAVSPQRAAVGQKRGCRILLLAPITDLQLPLCVQDSPGQAFASLDESCILGG